MRILIFFYIILAVVSCRTTVAPDEGCDIRMDVRLGTRFYSMFLNEKGYSYVKKGTGTFYTEKLKIDSFSVSNLFEVDSIRNLTLFLERLGVDTLADKRPMGTFPRVEIYYKGAKVYDAYRWNQAVWDALWPIVPQLPKGFNPFRVDDHPFE